MDREVEIIPVRLANGKVVQVEVTRTGGEEDVAGRGTPSFDGVLDAITGVSQSLLGVLEAVKPRKATIECGFEIATEAGELTALFVKGHGTASIKVTLEWEERSVNMS